MKKMNLKDDGGGGVYNERLTVAVRVRPPCMSMDGGGGVILGKGNGQRAVTIVNPKTLVLIDPPPADSITDLEHHFRTGTIFHTPPRGQNARQPANNNGKQQRYEFDRVYEEAATQEEIYTNTAAPLIRSVLEGFYATIFAYGATSSGKTYTMVGTPSNPGIMARAVDDIFHLCSRLNKIHCEVFLSYLEVYNEQIRDLLRPVPGISLELREDKDQVHVAGLSEIRTTTTTEVLELLQKGNRARTMESTAANVTSSRSHAVLLVTVRQRPVGSGQVVEGKLYLIDLAGSERASNTKNSGVRLREGGHINRSLLALGNCITALSSGDDKYINYRDSKLTRLLKAALGGASKTAMIAHISAGARMYEETRNTLMYAQRARAISNRVKKFIQIPTPLDGGSYNVIQELRNEVKRLQMKLADKSSGAESFDDESLPKSPPVTKVETLKRFTKSQPSPVPPPQVAPKHENYRVEHERSELEPIKAEILRLFEEEFKLRNDLLKLDGAMLQSALDCEILRLMVLDWENLKVVRESEQEGNVSSDESEDTGKSEITSVMIELKQVRQEQNNLLRMRTDVESELRRIRSKIVAVEEGATHYLPEVQRLILSLLCKLQQEQVSKMSVEIEAELKRRGALLLRCLRQKALGEAIIHRQRHFLNAAISGGYNRTNGSNLETGGISPFFPALNTPQQPIKKERLFYTPPRNPPASPRLPPISSAGAVASGNGADPVPKTTKYTDYYAQQRQRQKPRRSQRWSSEEELGDKGEIHYVKEAPPRRRRQDRIVDSY